MKLIESLKTKQVFCDEKLNFPSNQTTYLETLTSEYLCSELIAQRFNTTK